MLANTANSDTMVTKSAFGAVASLSMCQVLLEYEISIFTKLFHRRKNEEIEKFLSRCLL